MESLLFISKTKYPFIKMLVHAYVDRFWRCKFSTVLFVLHRRVRVRQRVVHSLIVQNLR